MSKLIDVNNMSIINSISDGDKIFIMSDNTIKQINVSNIAVEQSNSVDEVSSSIEELKNTKQDKLPEITSDDEGKFLMVSDSGTWTINLP